MSDLTASLLCGRINYDKPLHACLKGMKYRSPSIPEMKCLTRFKSFSFQIPGFGWITKPVPQQSHAAGDPLAWVALERDLFN